VHTGSAIKPLPISEPLHPEDQPLGFMPPATTLKPRWTDFDVAEGSLFNACERYLECARAIIRSARELSEKIHGDSELSRPPDDM
jgi:hypothetical protein